MKSFLTGLGVGFGVAMLIAPRSGSETRAQIGEKAGDWWEAGKEQARRVTESSGDLLGSAREQAKKVGEKISGALGDGSRLGELLHTASPGDAALNTITREQLLSVYGIGPVLADKIIAGRPYKSADELLERGIPEAAVKELKRELLKKFSA
jgi:DNA uptake protein ComE-like DNA-binding protein